MLSGDVGGRAELRHVQGILLRSDRELQARLLKETRAALRPTQKEVKLSAARLPSGYAPTMARAVKVQTRTSAASGGGVRARVRVTAMGKSKKRDVARVNLGRLRHPIFATGPRATWRWIKFDQMVKPRFVADPIDKMRDRINDGAERAADDVADEIVRG